MKRRPLLHAFTAGTLSLAGCLGSPGSSESPTNTTPDDETATNEAEPMTDAAFAVERVETFEYAVRFNDLGANPSGGITTVSDLESRERNVLQAALADGYETDDPPEWLVKFASGTTFVRKDGTYYRLEDDLPTYTLTAEAVAESDVSGKIASYDAYERAVTHDGVVMSGLMRTAEDGGQTLGYLWSNLEAFVEQYDAVRYHGDVLDFSLSVEDSGAPYSITAERVPMSEAVGEDVWNASSASEDLRRFVRKAGHKEGVYRFSDAPSGLFEKVDANEYVYLDGTFYTTYVEKRESVPVSLSAEFTDATADGGALRLELRNESDAELRISSGAPRPFGVLNYHPKGDESSSATLWTDAYEETNYVKTEGESVTMVLSIGLMTKVAPGETVGRTFEVDGGLAPGRYVIEGNVGVERGGNGGGATLPYRVVFRRA